MVFTAGVDVATGDLLSADKWNAYMGNAGSIMETGVAKVTTAGDLIYATGANAVARLAKGTARQALAMNAGATSPEWQASPQSLMTAKGDLIGASASYTLARLAVGANDTALTADSSESTGLKWAAGGTQPSNNFVGSSVMSGSAAGITGVAHAYGANEILFFPLAPLEADTTIKGCWGRLTAVTGSSNYIVGVYSSNKTTLTKIAEGSSTSLVAGTGKKYSGGLEASCSVGTQYYMAIIFSASTSITMMNSTSPVNVSILGFSGVNSAASYALPSSIALSSLTLEQFAWNGPVDVNSGYDL